MDDLSARLAEILNDPKAMNEIRSMAEGLFSEKPQEKSEKPQIMNTVKSRQDNTRAQLLLALKPHLSEPRREKVDTAVKLLQLIEALPLLKESGLLNLL